MWMQVTTHSQHTERSLATESFLGAENVVRPLGAVHSTDMEQRHPQWSLSLLPHCLSALASLNVNILLGFIPSSSASGQTELDLWRLNAYINLPIPILPKQLYYLPQRTNLCSYPTYNSIFTQKKKVSIML